MQTIDTHGQASAAWMEHQILEHVKQALRVTLNWKVPAVGMPRKLNSLQFTMKSFDRHLQRIMDLEEQDGYMKQVAESKPNMSDRVGRLQKEHEEFRAELSTLAPEVESLKEFETERFEQVCERICQLLEKVDRHDEDEIELLQETLLYDEGGEG